ncbi:MAG: hypothetical protein ABSA50_05170 [Candidatus Bathyarchaeia archaeon]
MTSISGNYDPNNVWVYNDLWARATGSTSLTPGEAIWFLVTSSYAEALVQQHWRLNN